MERNTWDKLAESYLQSIGKDEATTFAFEKHVNSLSILSLCLSEGTVLDLGCGDGRFTRLLEARFERVVAVDSSEKLLDAARKICPNTKFINSDLEDELPELDTKFDLVVSKLLLMYITNLDLLAKNISKIIKPGGELVISVTHPMRWVAENNRVDYLAEPDLTDYIAHDKNLPIVFHTRTFSTYVNTFSKCGFSLRAVLEPGATDSFVIEYPQVYDQVTPYRLNLRFLKEI